VPRGPYAQQGGFLSAFPKPVGPALTVVRLGGEFVLSWPNGNTGFHLECTPSLPDNAWSDLGEGAVVGARREVRVPAIGRNFFFRLRKDCPG